MTLAGRTVLGVTVVALLIGWRLGWQEFTLIGLIGLFALLGATPFVVGLRTQDVRRTVEIDHLEVGQVAEATVVVGGRRRWGTDLVERISITTDAGTRLDRLPLDMHAALARYPIPSQRRGVVDLGPVELSKGDPLGLLRRSVTLGGDARVWVQPRTVAVNPVAAGYSKDLEGPTSDASPAGDIAFHALRGYTVGDDHRHIHWMSSARTGDLMVKHHVDNRQPNLAVLLDDRATDGFELAVSVAASLVVSGLRGTGRVSLAVGDAQRVTSANPCSTRSVMETLTAVAPSPAASPISSLVTRLVRAEPDASVVAVVTGPRTAQEVLEIVARAAGRHVIVVRCGPQDGRLASVPGATVIDSEDLAIFARAWNAALT